MRERITLSFDMENPRHHEALRILNEQPKRLRTEYVVCCLLQVQQGETIEQLIRESVQKSLRSLPANITVPSESGNPQSDTFSDLPDSLIHAMYDL